MISYAWYYLTTGKKRHVVRETELAAFPQQSAICGTGVLSILPSKARWQNDAEGLEERAECASCAKTLEAEHDSVITGRVVKPKNFMKPHPQEVE